jgi:hypothetical protein
MAVVMPIAAMKLTSASEVIAIRTIQSSPCLGLACKISVASVELAMLEVHSWIRELTCPDSNWSGGI